MSDKELDDTVDHFASHILEALSEMLPDWSDDGALGELVLIRALKAYRMVNEHDTK